MTRAGVTARERLRGVLDARAGRFLAAGGVTAALGFVLFRAFLRLLGGQPRAAWAAQAIAYAICVAVSYALNHAWTFRSDGGHARQLPRFLAAHLGSLTLSSALIQAGASTLRLPLLACWVFATGVTTVTNFALQRFWVFADAPR